MDFSGDWKYSTFWTRSTLHWNAAVVWRHGSHFPHLGTFSNWISSNFCSGRQLSIVYASAPCCTFSRHSEIISFCYFSHKKTLALGKLVARSSRNLKTFLYSNLVVIWNTREWGNWCQQTGWLGWSGYLKKSTFLCFTESKNQRVLAHHSISVIVCIPFW